MARLPSNILNPNAGSASSLIKWMVARGYTTSQIIRKAEEKFPGFQTRTLERIHEHWKDQKSAALALKKAPATKDVADIISPGASKTTRNVRVQIKIGLNIGDIDEEREGGFTLDIPNVRTKADLDKAIKERLSNWLIDFYDVPSRNMFGPGKAIEWIEVTSIEDI